MTRRVPLPPRKPTVYWLLTLIVALTGLHQAEAIAAHFAISASEVRFAIGGALLGLPIALAIAALEARLSATRQRFSRY